MRESSVARQWAAATRQHFAVASIRGRWDEKETSLAARGDGRRVYPYIRGSATTSPFNDSRVV